MEDGFNVQISITTSFFVAYSGEYVQTWEDLKDDIYTCKNIHAVCMLSIHDISIQVNFRFIQDRSCKMLERVGVNYMYV